MCKNYNQVDPIFHAKISWANEMKKNYNTKPINISTKINVYYEIMCSSERCTMIAFQTLVRMYVQFNGLFVKILFVVR